MYCQIMSHAKEGRMPTELLLVQSPLVHDRVAEHIEYLCEEARRLERDSRMYDLGTKVIMGMAGINTAAVAFGVFHEYPFTTALAIIGIQFLGVAAALPLHTESLTMAEDAKDFRWRSRVLLSKLADRTEIKK
jgi:hypothetical protein